MLKQIANMRKLNQVEKLIPSATKLARKQELNEEERKFKAGMAAFKSTDSNAMPINTLFENRRRLNQEMDEWDKQDTRQGTVKFGRMLRDINERANVEKALSYAVGKVSGDRLDDTAAELLRDATAQYKPTGRSNEHQYLTDYRSQIDKLYEKYKAENKGHPSVKYLQQQLDQDQLSRVEHFLPLAKKKSQGFELNQKESRELRYGMLNMGLLTEKDPYARLIEKQTALNQSLKSNANWKQALNALLQMPMQAQAQSLAADGADGAVYKAMPNRGTHKKGSNMPNDAVNPMAQQQSVDTNRLGINAVHMLASAGTTDAGRMRSSNTGEVLALNNGTQNNVQNKNEVGKPLEGDEKAWYNTDASSSHTGDSPINKTSTIEAMLNATSQQDFDAIQKSIPLLADALDEMDSNAKDAYESLTKIVGDLGPGKVPTEKEWNKILRACSYLRAVDDIDYFEPLTNLDNKLKAFGFKKTEAGSKVTIVFFNNKIEVHPAEYVLFIENPILSVIGYNSSIRANEITSQYFPDEYKGQKKWSSDDSEINAFRHAFWNAYLTYRTSAEEAKLITDAHEYNQLEGG